MAARTERSLDWAIGGKSYQALTESPLGYANQELHFFAQYGDWSSLRASMTNEWAQLMHGPKKHNSPDLFV